MNSKDFFKFVFIQLIRYKSHHVAVFLLSILLITLLSSFFFVTNSIEHSTKNIIDNNPDFIVQKIKGGKTTDTPLSWVDDILQINGVSDLNARVYGRYFYEPNEHSFTIVGVDFYDKQIQNSLKLLVKDLNIEEFLNQPNMIIGSGVKKFFDYYEYDRYYSFRTPTREIKRVYIYDLFDKSSNIVSADTIFMDISVAKEILGLKEEQCTDIVFNVSNQTEWETIKNKITVAHFDSRIITKDELNKYYTNFFTYHSSLFTILYFICLLTFLLILFQRYSTITQSQKKSIGILKSIGWSIPQIIKLKFTENFLLFTIAFFIAINLAYLYVFIFNAPLITSIFFGHSNLIHEITLIPTIDLSTIALLYLYFMIPILSSVIFPIWKLSITDPSEVIK